VKTKAYNALVVAFAIYFLYGLHHITAPPLDKDMWRQTLTLGMAQEFLELDNIFYPRTIIGGDSDIIAAECPIYQYLLSRLYLVLGKADWYGRFVNWIVFFGALSAFYKFGKNYFQKMTMQLAACSWLVSIAANYARMTMPDVFSFSLAIIGVYCGDRYLRDGKNWQIILSVILIGVAGLNKLPYMMMCGLLLIPLLDKNNSYGHKKMLFLGLIVSTIPVIWWYFYWVPYLLETYKNQLFWSYSIAEGFVLFITKLEQFFLLLFKNTFHNVLLVISSLYGLYCIAASDKKLLYPIIFMTFAFLFFGIKSGTVLPTHEYYFIPLVPMLSLGIGEAFRILVKQSKYFLILFAMMLLPGLIRNHRDTYRPLSSYYLQSLPKIVETYIPKNAKIIVNYGPNDPSMMYWAQRKGMTVHNEYFINPAWRDDLIKKGILFGVQDRHKLTKKLTDYEVVYEGVDFLIYKIPL
jgi:hypothetical protein